MCPGVVHGLTLLQIMADPLTGISRGFGFVRFSLEDDCKRALVEMQGVVITPSTGVSPGRHGIVANDFHRILRDNSSEAFFYQDPARSWNGSWWGAEPLWSVAERAGQSSAVLAWPGPPITSHGERPRHFQRYVKGWSTADRLRTIERWLDMGSVDERPSLICGELHGISSPLHDADAQSVAYVPDVDAAAHGAGPDPSDPSVAAALRAVDDFIAALLRSIAARNASELVDVVVGA